MRCENTGEKSGWKVGAEVHVPRGFCIRAMQQGHILKSLRAPSSEVASNESVLLLVPSLNTHALQLALSFNTNVWGCLSYATTLSYLDLLHSSQARDALFCLPACVCVCVCVHACMHACVRVCCVIKVQKRGVRCKCPPPSRKRTRVMR